MTRGEEFERLQFQSVREKNNSLLNTFIHSDCTYESKSVPTALKGLVPATIKGRDKVNIMWDNLWDNFDAGTQKVIYEDENQVHVHHHYKLKSTEAFFSVTQKVTIKDGKIFHHQEEYEDLDHDPSEGQSWTWQDVKWLHEMVTATEVAFEEWQTFANQKGIPTLTNSSTNNEWSWNLS